MEKETTETECPCVVGFPRCHERLALQPEGVIAATVRCNQKVTPTCRIFSIALWVELDASVFCSLRRDFLIESAIGEQSARTEIQQSLWSGPALSQLDLLLPIGSRATPDLRKLTLSIEAACVVPARGPQYILAQGSWPAKIKVHCDLRGYNTIIHRNSFWNRVSGHCFSILYGPAFFQKQLVKAESALVLKLFSVSVVSVSYVAGQVFIVAARYSSTVVAVSLLTCLL